MDSGSFGSFAQRMFDAGLVFHIEFTEEELEILPCWTLFDKKIVDGISALPSELVLPPRPPNMPSSANSTLWTFVQCHSQLQRGHPGRRSLDIIPPKSSITPPMYTLKTVIRELATPNPICYTDSTSFPQDLVIIGMSS